jgi:hypothetical protein
MPAQRNTTEEPEQTAADERGVLQLASGTLVRVPAEGVQVATEHYDPDLKATVPVVGRFVLND